MTARVTPTGDSTALVAIEVHDAAGRTAFHRVWDAEPFEAGTSRTFSATWTPPPTASGTYVLTIAVLAPHWGDLYAWLDPAATFQVEQPGGPPASSAPTTTSAGPTVTHPEMSTECPGVPMVTPIGAIPPALPMYCHPLATGVPPTNVTGPNTWVDDFDHHASMADLGPGYKTFETSLPDLGSRTGTFRHNDHWMVDVYAPHDGVGGSVMRPDRTFRFDDGILVVETDVAAGIEEYGGFAWPELTVTTASSPDGADPYGPTPASSTGDSLYAYGHFGGYDTVGVRLSGAEPVMAYYDSTERGFSCGRIWEFSWFQDGSDGPESPCPHPVQSSIFGGNEWAAPGAVRTCVGTDPDIDCRDRFRWELSRDKITLYANGQKLMEHTALPGVQLLPDAILEGDVYVYFSSWVYQPPSDRVVRYHWDRVAVNPPNGPTPAPGYVGAP